MAAILNCAILDSAILHKKELHSFILTQLDDGSHLELCHVGFRHCHLGFRHLVIFPQIHSKTLSLHSDSDSNYFILTQTHSFSLNLMMIAILYSAILNSLILDSAIFLKTLTPTNSIWLKVIHSDSTWWWQPSWIHSFFTKINFTHSFWINMMMAAILNSAILDSAILHKKNLYSFILTQLDDGSHHELCHLGFRHCHLGFRHLVIFSQIHSKILSLHFDSDSNLFNLIDLMMATILNSAIFGFIHFAQHSDSI